MSGEIRSRIFRRLCVGLRISAENYGIAVYNLCVIPMKAMAVMESNGGDWKASLISVSYDVEKTVEDIHTSGLFERAGAFSRSIIATMRTGHDYKKECLKLVLSYEAAGEANIEAPALWARAADELGI